MKYIVFPKENLNEIPQEVLNELHLVPRLSVDGTQVIMKLIHYEILFPTAVTLELDDEAEEQEIVYPYPVYEGDSLNELLASDDWSAKDELESDTVLDKPSTQSAKSRKKTKSTVL